MATVYGSPAVKRGQMLRDGWQVIAGHSSNFFGRTFSFFSSYPPLAQGLYYLLSGLWLMLGSSSYQKVTGYQGDAWLVDAVGVLLLMIGGTFCLAAYRRQGSPEVLFLAFGTALGLTMIDILLIYRGLSIFYLIDAAIQVMLVVFWVFGWRAGRVTVTAPVAQIAPEPLPPR